MATVMWFAPDKNPLEVLLDHGCEEMHAWLRAGRLQQPAAQ